MQTCPPSSTPQSKLAEPLCALIAAAQHDHTLFPAYASGAGDMPQPVVVAVSGGADSVVLLHLLAQNAAAWKLTLHVAHVDHDLRPASADDAGFVRSLADAYGLPYHTVRLNGAVLCADPAGLEAAARAARYSFLCATANNVTPPDLVPVVATAHHADDQAETLLLRLVQGSGADGLAGMRPATLLFGETGENRPVRLVRPLLAAPRAMIREYAQRHALEWREDESNTDSTRARNLLRNEVLPRLERINPNVAAALARTAALLADEADRLRASDEETCRRLTVMAMPDRVLLQLAGVQALTHADRRGLLRAVIDRLGGGLRELNFGQFDRLADEIAAANHNTGPHPLPHGLAWSVVPDNKGEGLCLALHRHDTLAVEPPGPWLPPMWRAKIGSVPLDANCVVKVGEWMLTCDVIAPAALPLNWRRNPDRWLAYFDRELIAVPELTPFMAGMQITPLGMGGRHRQVGDLFTDRKIIPALRAGWPVLHDRTSDRVIWVCGLAQSHHARITDSARFVWVVRWERRPS